MHPGAKVLTATILSLIILTVPVSEAYAHRVTVFAWVAGDRIHTESRFSGGKPVKGGKIIVYDDRSDERLLEGATDDEGGFSFNPPRKTRLRIEMIAGMGHKNEWVVKEEELGVEGETGKAAAVSTPSEPSQPPGEDRQGSAEALTTKQIELAIEKALDRKLAPMMKLLAESRQQEPGIRDVVGGIGYILGLVGIGAYFRFRRRSDPPPDHDRQGLFHFYQDMKQVSSLGANKKKIDRPKAGTPSTNPSNGRNVRPLASRKKPAINKQSAMAVSNALAE